ncbi:MAG: hypothetical protein E7462_05345 [Ruminococcaceae bacterium]|nr:hypothetical protein [Oscillospiraceae bacterium]
MYDGLPEVDDTVKIIRIDRVDKTPLCVLFDFGCHPLVGFADNGTTSNFPGIAERFITEHTGAEAMMFQSTGGDATELDYKNYFYPKDCTPWGTILGQTVVSAVNKIETKEAELDFFAVEREFPLRTDISQRIDGLEKRNARNMRRFFLRSA